MDFELSRLFGEAIINYWDYLLRVLSYVWPVAILFIIYMGYMLWLYGKQIAYSGSINYEFIAITVPADNVKDPKFMEQVLNGFHSIHKPLNFYEGYVWGMFQLSASMELVGIDGSVQFIIRMADFHRKAFESFIYAFYPEAEIETVEDYTAHFPDRYPDDEYDMWGSEAELRMDDAYPIKTYKEFAEDIEKGFIDPISALIEAMSMLNPGETFAMQIILQPRWDEAWLAKVSALVDEKMNRSKPADKGWFHKYIIGSFHGAQRSVDTALGFPIGEDAMDEDGGFSFLSPGEQRQLRAIEESMSKIAFKVKVRFVYVARKEVYNKVHAMMAAVTFMRMFIDENLNGFKPNTDNWTSVDYFKEERLPRRKRIIMENFKSRDGGAGGNTYVMSVQEIATMYHFPYTSVKAPTIERAETRKAEAPSDLPLAQF